MTRKRRMAISNGIWMCQTHSKLIDTDEQRFTIGILKKWRELSEHRARLEQELGRAIDLASPGLGKLTMASCLRQLQNGRSLNRRIADALNDSCVSVLWGPDLSDALRDVLVEIVRNAFTHGGATNCRLEVAPRTIRLVENGTHFSPWKLATRRRGRGGSTAVRALLSTHGNHLVVDSRTTKSNSTEHVVALLTPELSLETVTPCVVQFSRDDDFEVEARLSCLQSCDTIYAPIADFGSYSDLDEVLAALERLLAETKKQVVFVTGKVSSGVVTYFKSAANRRFPGCRFVARTR